MNIIKVVLIVVAILINNSISICQHKKQKPKSNITFRTSNVEDKPEWEYIDKFDDGGYLYQTYYNRKNLILSNGLIKVWIMEDPLKSELNKARLKIINDRIEAKLYVKDYELYTHTLQLYDVDCKARKFRLASSVDYGENGQVLDSLDIEGMGRWKNMIPSSVGDTMFSQICTDTKYAGN